MATCGSFLETAKSKCGVDVGFGQLLLIYAAKRTLKSADLTSDAINAEIEAGTIIGVVKGWHTIAGAPVAEVSVERTGTSEMKNIRAEILADTITFESNMINRTVIGDLVKSGTLDGVLVDHIGNAFAETSEVADAIDTMKLNFSGKVSGALQSDNVTDKSVAVTVRYLVNDLGIVEAGIEVEEVATKTALYAGISSVVSISPTSMVVDFTVKEKGTNIPFAGAIIAANVTVSGSGVTGKTLVYTPSTGKLTLTISGTGFVSGDTAVSIAMSGATFYQKATKYSIRLGE
jgi:hypothetical protein